MNRNFSPFIVTKLNMKSKYLLVSVWHGLCKLQRYHGKVIHKEHPGREKEKWGKISHLLKNSSEINNVYSPSIKSQQ